MKKITKYKIHIQLSLIVVLLLALLVKGSLAWQDISQHKTNKFYTKPLSHSVVLVENFKPITQWELDEQVVHQVNVRNGQETDNVNKFAYTDGFIRLQLREFMGIASEAFELSTDRLMVDKNGQFYRFEAEADAKKLVKDLKLSSPDDRVVKLTGIDDKGVEHFYIKSMSSDKNGQYGKFLILKIKSDDLISIVSNQDVIGLDDDISNKHNNIDPDNPNLEDTNIYTTHLWNEGDSSFTPSSSPFKQYVEWQLGTDVITLNDWINNHQSKPVKKWIVDTRSTGEGWVYWGDTLEHSNQNNDPNNITSMLLESIKLIKQPKGRAEYRIHVNMDAVSFEDLDDWQNAPQEIMDLFKIIQ